MTQPRGSGGGRASTLEYRSELLGRLGLSDAAGDQDIEGTYRDVLDFLDSAPHAITPWASAQRDEVDEAFALLAGSEEALASAAAEHGPALVAQPDPRSVTQPAPQPRRPREVAAAPTAPARGRRNLLVWIVPVLVAAVVFGVYYAGKGSSVPGISGQTTSSATSTGGTVDQAQVAALMQKISANPKDVTSLQGLGDQYFQAGDYKTASDWENKVLAIDPKNQDALLALGAAQFNLGNADAAKKQWLAAEKLYPNNAEVHYDLGFLYMSQSPSDTANMKAEWQKVIDIDPNSDLAKTVSTHLSGSTPSASASK